MARRARALILALSASALPVMAGCGLGDPGPSAGQPSAPVVTRPAPGPAGGGSGPDGGAGGPEVQPCSRPEDVTAMAPGDVRPARVVTGCDRLEVPVPFTVPGGGGRPGSV
jgi:hypothetical protein